MMGLIHMAHLYNPFHLFPNRLKVRNSSALKGNNYIRQGKQMQPFGETRELAKQHTTSMASKKKWKKTRKCLEMSQKTCNFVS